MAKEAISSKSISEKASLTTEVAKIEGNSDQPKTQNIIISKLPHAKSYHVHVNPNPHYNDDRKEAYKCHDPNAHSNNGCRFNIQEIMLGTKNHGISGFGAWEYGHATLGTCSKIKLWLYLRWLNLKGFRKDQRWGRGIPQ